MWFLTYISLLLVPENTQLLQFYTPTNFFVNFKDFFFLYLQIQYIWTGHVCIIHADMSSPSQPIFIYCKYNF